MAEAQSSSKKGLTRGKAILIGVLAIVLVVVLYVQFGNVAGEKPTNEPAGNRPPRPAVAVQPVNSPTNPVTLATAKTPSIAPADKEKKTGAEALIDVTRWKSPKLESIVDYDPFALPASFPQPPKAALGKGKGPDGLIAAAAAEDAKKLAEAIEKRYMQLEELKQRGVHVITVEGNQYVAWIGDRKLHVGDKINEFTVTAIDRDGVHVERIESP